MTAFVSQEFRVWSPGASNYVWGQRVRAWVASSPANGSQWRDVIGTWAVHGGVWISLDSGAGSDAQETASGASSYCNQAAGHVGETVYRRWVEFSSPTGNTTSVQIQWLLDGANDGPMEELIFGSKVYGPIRDTHTFAFSLGPGTGVDDGNDHTGSYTWRRRNFSDNQWSVWFHGGAVGGPLMHNEAGC